MAAELTPDQEQSLVTQFFQKSDDFMKLYTWMQAEAPKYQGTSMGDDINAVLIEGEKKRSLIDNIVGTLNTIFDWGTSAWDSITDWASKNIPGMGLWPAIFLGAGITAGIASAITAMNVWMTHALKEKDRMDLVDFYVAQGYSFQDAMAIANKEMKSRAEKSTLDKIIIIGGLGLGAFLLFQLGG